MARYILSAFADEASGRLDGQILALKRNGIRYIELRGVDGKSVKDLTDDEARAVRAKLDEAGIAVSSMGSPFGKISVADDFQKHKEEFKHALTLCKILGTDKMRMFSFYYPKDQDPALYREEVLSRLREMLSLAKDAGITLCHENEKGIYGDTADRCLDLLTAFNGDLQGIFDPANFIQCGEKSVESLYKLKEKLCYLHVKDAKMATGAVVPSGCGNGAIDEVLDIMASRAKDMFLSVEPHLTIFEGLKDLQGEALTHEYAYPDCDTAFDAAVGALKAQLEKIGFTPDGEGGYARSDDTVRVGIIGIGNMGSGHARMIYAGDVPGMTLSAVADFNPARLEWAEKELPGVTRFDDATKMMDSGLIDAVIVATPHYDHPRLVIEALGKGLHALCEKPAGVYTKAVREMNAAAEKSDKVFAIMFNQRTNCVYRKMKEIISSGEMGAIRRSNWIITNWFRSQSYYDSGAWRATWAGEGGGVLLNQCPHNLDLWQWLCGMPVRIRAFTHNGKWHDIEVEDDVTAYAEYENGATGVFITTTSDAPGTNRLEIDLDGGQLVCDGSTLIMRKLEMPINEFHKTYKGGFGSPKCVETVVETDGRNPQHAGVLRRFAAKILGRGELVASGAEGINGLMISNAMHLSGWLNETVSLPINEDQFLAELDKRRATSRHKTGPSKTFTTEGSYNNK